MICWDRHLSEPLSDVAWSRIERGLWSRPRHRARALRQSGTRDPRR